MTTGGQGAEFVISGALDYAVRDDVIARVEALMSRTDPNSTLFVTLAAVDFIDSSGVATLLAIRRLANNRGCTVVLTMVPKSVQAMLNRYGVASLF